MKLWNIALLSRAGGKNRVHEGLLPQTDHMHWSFLLAYLLYFSFVTQQLWFLMADKASLNRNCLQQIAILKLIFIKMGLNTVI